MEKKKEHVIFYDRDVSRHREDGALPIWSKVESVFLECAEGVQRQNLVPLKNGTSILVGEE